MRSFGPAVHHEKDGTFRPSCNPCIFRRWNDAGQAHSCSHVKPERIIPDTSNTPEWCEMRDGMLRDAQEMADFERLGIAGITRDALLRKVRELPPELQPKPLSKAKAHALRQAIRRAKVGGAA